MRYFISLLFLSIIFTTTAQNHAGISLEVVSDDNKAFIGEFTLADAVHYNSIYAAGRMWQIPYIKGCGYLQQTGLPALPSFSLKLASENSNPHFKFTSLESDTLKNILIYPWIGMPVDYTGAPEPEFTINTIFYNTDSSYPHANALHTGTQKYRDNLIVSLRICPFSYNPSTGTLIIHRKFKISAENLSSQHSKKQQSTQANTLAIVKNSVVNKGFFENNKNQHIDDAPAYLIITHSDYIQAAEQLSLWREQTGYKTEIFSSSSWTSASIAQSIRDRFFQTGTKPTYVVLIGDHNTVPGNQFLSSHGIFPTDKPYVYMDGPSDYTAEMAIGRISATSPQQAMLIVEKIIQYEKNPVVQVDFYNNVLSAAYFQDDNGDTYADRRFAQTAEEMLQYLTLHAGKTVNRAYYTSSSTTPLYWNNTYYSAGEPVPSHLLKPTFPWLGNANNIRTFINNGSFLVYHRDHGYDKGWGDPAFNNTNVASLTNGNKLPIVASVNCQTGKFLVAECFSEALLRHPNGGAVGVFGHAEVSYSGYNDGLAMGLADAIFPQPGLIPNFTGSGSNPGTYTPGTQILTMGDVADQSLLRMAQTWGDNWGLEEYQNNIFHYFGDPATRIFTQTPNNITASHQQHILCGDTLFAIYSCNIPDALATITIDGKLAGFTYLQNGIGQITFMPTASTHIILTISAPNTKPYIQNIALSGLCVVANFEQTYPASPCINNTVAFENRSSGFYTQLLWDFGTDATPATAIGEGPHYINYSSSGAKTIELIAVSPLGNDTTTSTLHISNNCHHIMPPHGQQILTGCQGVLFDNGNAWPYSSGSSHTIITSPGASQININFTQFDIQASTACNNAYVRIVSGTLPGGTVLGTFCNNNAPIGVIPVYNDTVSIYFYAETNSGYEGFEMEWQCIQQALPPIANFQFQNIGSCGAVFQFYDNSLHQAHTFLWDFGDGHTSTLQNPVHEYTSNGIFSVSLTATNNYGSHTFTLPAAISVSTTAQPNDTTITVCRPQIVNIPGGTGDKVFWYDNNTSISPIAVADTLTYFAQNSISEFYCRTFSPGTPLSGGKPTNSGTGAFFNASVVHFLGFDVFEPIVLQAVTVYAQDDGNRTISVRNGNDELIHSSVHYLTTGINRVQLDYLLPPDNDYKIDAGQFCKLFRNGDPNGPDFFPLDISGLLTINRSSAGYPNASKYYYFFYDWEIAPLCISASAKKQIFVEIPDTTIQAWPATSLCLADSILLSALIGLSYTWFPCGETGQFSFASQSGNYFALLTSANCSSMSNTITIEGEHYPIASFEYITNGYEVVFTNTSTGTNYLWNFGDGTTSTNMHPVHTFDGDGTYTVTLIVFNSCGSDTLTETITLIVEDIPEHENFPFTVYPNPAADMISIEFSETQMSECIQIQIYNVLSQMLIFKECNQGMTKTEIPLVGLSPGMYVISVVTTHGQASMRFIKL